MAHRSKRRRLTDGYTFPRDFVRSHGAWRIRRTARARGHAWPSLKKTVCGACRPRHHGCMTAGDVGSVICPAAPPESISTKPGSPSVDCRTCGAVKREQLAFLADNPFCHKALYVPVGRRCRKPPIGDVAHELEELDRHTVKILEMQYMRAQLTSKPRTPAPKGTIGIDLRYRSAKVTAIASSSAT